MTSSPQKKLTSRRNWLLISPSVAVLGVAVAAVLAVASWTVGLRLHQVLFGSETVAAASPGPSYSISGRVRLSKGDFQRTDGGCRSSRFSGIHEGAQVVVTDGTGAALSYARLGTGVMSADRCDFPFTLNVPAGEGAYGVDVPQRGQLRYTEAELRNLLELTIG